MPTVFYWKGYRFYFFSLEDNEPVHIYVEKAEGSSKFWIEPAIVEEYSYGFSLSLQSQRKEIRKFIEQNKEQIKKTWNEHFKNS